MNSNILDRDKDTLALTNPLLQTERTLRNLERDVEILTGEKAETLRLQTLPEWRSSVELRVKKKFSFASAFPLIGRGSVMRNRIIDHEAIETLLDKHF